MDSLRSLCEPGLGSRVVMLGMIDHPCVKRLMYAHGFFVIIWIASSDSFEMRSLVDGTKLVVARPRTRRKHLF